MTVKEILLSLLNSDKLSADTETSSLDFMRGEIGCFTLCNDGINGYYIPVRFLNEENKQLLLQVFKTAKRLVFANGKFDIKFIWKFLGITSKDRFYITDDTVQLSHAIFPGRPAGLKPGALFFTPYGGYDDELDKYRKSRNIEKYTDIQETVLSQYATMDAIATWRLLVALETICHELDEKYPNEKQIETRKLGKQAGKDWTIWRWYKEVMMPMVNDLSDLEYDGLYISKSNQEKGYEHFKKEEEIARKQLSDAWKSYGVTPDFEFMSNKQLGELLLRMGWDVGTSDKGEYELGDAILQDYVRFGKEEIKYLQRLRAINTILGTFIGYTDEKGQDKGWLQYFRYHEEDDSIRIHTNFQSMMADSFRHRSAEPNFQNLPSRTNEHNDAEWCKKMVDVPHTFQYRVKFNNKEYLFKFNDKVKTITGEKLAKDLVSTDDLFLGDWLDPYEVKKEKVVRKIKT